MKLFLLSDNEDTAVGMRLAGIEGTIISDGEEFKKSLDKISDDKEIGIVLINEALAQSNSEAIDAFRKEHSVPVVIEIPDRNPSGAHNSIAEYVRKAIGITI